MVSLGRQSRPALAAVAGVLLFAVVLRLPPWTPLAARAVDDVGQLLAAVLASLASWRRAARTPGRDRRCWQLLGTATATWAAGETVRSHAELLSGRTTPFPSAADLGFLAFPLLTSGALLMWPSTALRGAARPRALLDGTLVARSLFLISWATALGSTLHAGADGTLASVVSLAYPTTDLVLLTVTVVVLAQAQDSGRSRLPVLAAGLAALCVADSGFAYLTATGRYATGSIIDVGWVAGFLLIASAASAAPTSSVGVAAQDEPGPTDGGRGPDARSVRGHTLLPYLPAGLGLGAALLAGLTGRGTRTSLLAAAVVVTVLLGRQLLAVLDNQHPIRELVSAQRALHHQAIRRLAGERPFPYDGRLLRRLALAPSRPSVGRSRAADERLLLACQALLQRRRGRPPRDRNRKAWTSGARWTSCRTGTHRDPEQRLRDFRAGDGAAVVDLVVAAGMFSRKEPDSSRTPARWKGARTARGRREDGARTARRVWSRTPTTGRDAGAPGGASERRTPSLPPQPGAGSASAARLTSARRCCRKARSAALAVSSLARRYD